ncbi:alpha/beta hydrolase [Lacticaseibacillus hulanensis]|uniref:alpha/beta hydrolase n=1 Tax=Lacticaseibacillus hulanensis TaxID=2493111 RepID=UPI000FDB079E|nr:alpha/beta hydrolase [Lacticaseibacillus hulanensis]
MKKRTKVFAGIIIAALIMVAGGIGFLKHAEYKPSETAQQAAKTATETNYGLLFKASNQTGPTVIFYPGALVEPASYSVWAKKLAQAGYPVAIVRMPLDLAVLGSNKAGIVPVGKRGYVIGGHSLGGVMASRYAADHISNKLRGVYFLASYPDAKGSLAKTQLPVLNLTGSRDGVLNWQSWRKARQYLSADRKYRQLKGGNHAGFGSYGTQKGDNEATVTNGLQQDWIARQLASWLAGLK